MNIIQSLTRINIKVLSIVVFMLIFLISCLSTYFTYVQYTEKEKLIFQNSAKKIPTLLENRMIAYKQVLLAGTAKFYTSEKIKRKDWKRFVKELKLDENYPGIQGVGFSIFVNPSEKEKFISQIREEGFPFFDIKPKGDREIYTSIVYLEPFDSRNIRAFGYDMFSQETRKKAMSRAIETGKYSISGKVHLLQENGIDVQAGFLAYIPVYKTDKNFNTYKEKLENTLGFVYAPFRAKDLINAIELDENQYLDIMIYDGTEAKSQTLLYDSISNHNEINSSYSYKKIIEVGGNSWFIEVFPSKKFFHETKSYTYIFVFLTGILLSFLSFIIINVYAFSEKRKKKYYDNLKALSLRKDLALKAATIGIWEWTYSSNEMVWDKTMREIYGIEQSNYKNLILNTWKKCIEPSQRRKVIKYLFDSKKDNSEHNIRFWINTLNGEKKYIHSLATIEYDLKNNPIGMIGINIDISEYERNRQQLIEQKELIETQKFEFESIFKYSKDSIAIVDLDTKFLFFNDAYLKMTGYTKEQLLKKSALELTSFENRNKFYEILPIVKEKGFYENFEKTNITYDNKKIQIIMSMVLLPDKKRILITARDFSELKKKEKLIQDYVKLINENVIISSTNLNGIITSVSNAFCKVSGYSKEELLGSHHSIVRDPNTPNDLYKNMWKTLNSDNVWKGELQNITKDGKKYWLKATISPIFDDNNKKIGYTAIREDITDKKIIEQISITDALTQIYNRRYFNEVFSKYIQVAKRKNEIICFALMDVDFFKQYNDTYGHQEGDVVLQKIASILKKSLERGDDYCFRLGGEEFGLLFKTENKEKAFEFVDNIRKNIENKNIKHSKNSVSNFVTASFGVVCKNAIEIINDDNIYKEVDEFLYKAKEEGRNRVIINA